MLLCVCVWALLPLQLVDLHVLCVCVTRSFWAPGDTYSYMYMYMHMCIKEGHHSLKEFRLGKVLPFIVLYTGDGVITVTCSAASTDVHMYSTYMNTTCTQEHSMPTATPLKHWSKHRPSYEVCSPSGHY